MNIGKISNLWRGSSCGSAPRVEEKPAPTVEADSFSVTKSSAPRLSARTQTGSRLKSVAAVMLGACGLLAGSGCGGGSLRVNAHYMDPYGQGPNVGVGVQYWEPNPGTYGTYGYGSNPPTNYGNTYVDPTWMYGHNHRPHSHVRPRPNHFYNQTPYSSPSPTPYVPNQYMPSLNQNYQNSVARPWWHTHP